MTLILRVHAIPMLLALAGLLAGCGGGGDDEQSKTVAPLNCNAMPEHCR